jgi:ribonuclease P protein subunit POP4
MQRSTKTKDIPRLEFIGLNIEIIDSKNPTLKGLKGKIVDETKNIFIIENEDGEQKKIIKNQVEFRTIYKEKAYIIKGEILKGRPEERLKKKIKI